MPTFTFWTDVWERSKGGHLWPEVTTAVLRSIHRSLNHHSHLASGDVASAGAASYRRFIVWLWRWSHPLLFSLPVSFHNSRDYFWAFRPAFSWTALTRLNTLDPLKWRNLMDKRQNLSTNQVLRTSASLLSMDKSCQGSQHLKGGIPDKAWEGPDCSFMASTSRVEGFLTTLCAKTC